MAFFMKVNICIIGCGGTGGNLIARLARFLSGDTGDLTINVAIADGDTVEYKNVDSLLTAKTWGKTRQSSWRKTLNRAFM